MKFTKIIYYTLILIYKIYIKYYRREKIEVLIEYNKKTRETPFTGITQFNNQNSILSMFQKTCQIL